MIDTLMHRYGADCLSAASYFSRLRPRQLAAAINSALKQNTDELLFMRWCISGGGLSFAEFRKRIYTPPHKETAEEIHNKVKSMMDNTKWRRADGA